MSDSVTTTVEVVVPPDVAFDVFTLEIDAWYQVDTDALPDITRTAALRFEPYLGGRLLDVHDLTTGAGRELGRITAWEPGRRLAFTDNEGTEVDVDFERCRAGTRVTLTHRGLDRVAPARAGGLRRAGWAAIAPFYREHLAPNARPVALAIVFQALLLLTIVAALALPLTLASGLPAWAVASLTGALLITGAFAVLATQKRLVHRWLPSEWGYRRISVRLLGLLALAFLIDGLYRVIEHGWGVLATIGWPVVVLLACWSWEEQGPARGGSLRQRAGSAGTAFGRHYASARKFLLIVGFAAAAGGLLSVLRSADGIAQFISPALLTSWGALSLYEVVCRRCEKRRFGFDPDLYLAVARPVSEGHQPPGLLVHWDTKQQEYSGWYAYASEHDEHSNDFVVWSMRDLVDHSPEAAAALRESHGRWTWDHARGAYRPLEQLARDPQIA